MDSVEALAARLGKLERNLVLWRVISGVMLAAIVCAIVLLSRSPAPRHIRLRSEDGSRTLEIDANGLRIEQGGDDVLALEITSYSSRLLLRSAVHAPGEVELAVGGERAGLDLSDGAAAEADPHGNVAIAAEKNGDAWVRLMKVRSNNRPNGAAADLSVSETEAAFDLLKGDTGAKLHWSTASAPSPAP
jgi:hypothetical protein